MVWVWGQGYRFIWPTADGGVQDTCLQTAGASSATEITNFTFKGKKVKTDFIPHIFSFKAMFLLVLGLPEVISSWDTED